MFLVLSQSFRLFDVNLSLTGGGPGRETMGLALDIYTEGFRNNRMVLLQPGRDKMSGKRLKYYLR